MDTSTISKRLIPQIQYVTPTTGSTVTANTNGFTKLLINPAGSLLALTITMPSSPSDGDTLQLGSSQIVTTLTMNGGTIIGALTALAVAAFASYTYSSNTTSWFRTG